MIQNTWETTLDGFAWSTATPDSRTPYDVNGDEIEDAELVRRTQDPRYMTLFILRPEGVKLGAGTTITITTPEV